MGRVLFKNGHCMPGTKAFKPKGDGIITCYYCGRTLDNSLSQARGIGPICIKEYGPMEGREWIEGFADDYNDYREDERTVLSFMRWLEEIKKVSIPEILADLKRGGKRVGKYEVTKKPSKRTKSLQGIAKVLGV